MENTEQPKTKQNMRQNEKEKQTKRNKDKTNIQNKGLSQ